MLDRSRACLDCGAFSGWAADSDDSGLDVVKVRPNFYMIAGAGGNIGVQIGSDGVVLVERGQRGRIRPRSWRRSRS